ncbi:hypothetical protein FACS1894127_0610 [Clostridia bacterium]|nr:hypothetical protein FACS1894127_0610 [Clostridia bacterium]
MSNLSGGTVQNQTRWVSNSNGISSFDIESAVGKCLYEQIEAIDQEKRMPLNAFTSILDIVGLGGGIHSDNPRLFAQSGLFLLFGVDGSSLKSQAYWDADYLTTTNITPIDVVTRAEEILNPLIKVCFVDKDSKEGILKELRTLGIHYGTVLPGLSDIIRYVSNQ